MKELADYVEIPVNEVKELVFRSSQPVSLETKIGNGEDTILLDLLSADEGLPDQLIEIDCMKKYFFNG